MPRSLTWLGLMALLTVLVAACGGDGTLSDEAYFEAVEDVGADSDARAEPLFETFSNEAGDAPPDAETATAFLDGYQALFVAARAGTAALSAPSDLAAAHEALLDAMAAVIDEIGRARVRVEAGELESVFTEVEPAAFDEFARACATLEQLARDRGFHLELSCADG